MHSVYHFGGWENAAFCFDGVSGRMTGFLA